MTVTFSIKEELHMEKYMIVSNTSNVDKLMKIMKDKEIFKVVLLKKNCQKKILLTDFAINNNHITIKEII